MCRQNANLIQMSTCIKCARSWAHDTPGFEDGQEVTGDYRPLPVDMPIIEGIQTYIDMKRITFTNFREHIVYTDFHAECAYFITDHPLEKMWDMAKAGDTDILLEIALR